MLLCLGLVLLTAGNIQPRFRLVNRAVSSRGPRGPSHVLPLRFTRANVHMDSGGTVFLSEMHFGQIVVHFPAHDK